MLTRDQLYMAVCFWYFVKRDLLAYTSVTVAYTSVKVAYARVIVAYTSVR